MCTASKSAKTCVHLVAHFQGGSFLLDNEVSNNSEAVTTEILLRDTGLSVPAWGPYLHVPKHDARKWLENPRPDHRCGTGSMRHGSQGRLFKAWLGSDTPWVFPAYPPKPARAAFFTALSRHFAHMTGLHDSSELHGHPERSRAISKLVNQDAIHEACPVMWHKEFPDASNRAR
jgi:hypothetical protein